MSRHMHHVSLTFITSTTSGKDALLATCLGSPDLSCCSATKRYSVSWACGGTPVGYHSRSIYYDVYIELREITSVIAVLGYNIFDCSSQHGPRYHPTRTKLPWALATKVPGVHDVEKIEGSETTKQMGFEGRKPITYKKNCPYPNDPCFGRVSTKELYR